MGEVSTAQAVNNTIGDVTKNALPDIANLPSDWTLSERDLADLELLLNGAFDPLDGYLDEENYYSVLEKMRLVSGEVWPMPIVLPIPDTAAGTTNVHWMKCSSPKAAGVAKSIRLRDSVGTVVATLLVNDVYKPNLEKEMEAVLGTTDPAHPYVKHLLENHSNCVYIGGKVTKVNDIRHFDFTEYRLTPDCVKKHIKEKGWEVVVGFQTRNPMHCSHYELTRHAMIEAEKLEGKKAHLLLTPAVGPTQPGDIEYHIRVRCYKALLQRYEPNTVQLVLLSLAMRMAGPREAVWHAIIRRNYGCTHFIVGRDHAGPSTKRKDGSPFYGHYDAHKLLESVQNDIRIKPIFGKAMVYVGPEHGGYIQADQVTEGVTARNISGADMRRMLQSRSQIPDWFSFPEVVEELHKFYVPQEERGLCLYFTGLPCSGKSTLAKAMEASLAENSNEKRHITMLDADVIRQHLSKGLGFSKEDRSTNVRRIGYVASEIVKHGGICLVANIAPYQDDRAFNRNLITATGGTYVEVYVSTPIEICEERDVKELYKKARLGMVKCFTGVSDPYEEPTNAELTVDSSTNIYQAVKSVQTYLSSTGLIPKQ